MAELAVVLEHFNRKERNLLVRSVLGHNETPLHLSQKFRDKLASKLTISPIPANAWWATDYHLSWIAGALAVFFGDDAALTQGRPNPIVEGRRLVERNQEDVDLLIAAGQDLIMVEAKAHGAWSNSQIKSKLKRLELLFAYYSEIKRDEPPIRFHLLLTSPRPPQRLTALSPAWCGYGPDLAWIPLELAEQSVFEVTRCDEYGTSAEEGQNWRVVQHSTDA